MKGQIAQTLRGSIEYTLVGNGPVILACHGTSQDCHSAHGLEALTKAGFSLLTPSRPGYGHTPLDVGRSSVQAAETLVALLDCMNIKTCSVIAISGGGPTGLALAANFPQRIDRLILLAAVSQPEERIHEPSYKNQMAFYGPSHGIQWGMLRMISNLAPRAMARQTLAIFSTHDPDEAVSRLTPDGIEAIRQFYQGHSSRHGALNDATHTVGSDMLQAITVPVLVIHSREDKAVPFTHAEWSLKNLPEAKLCETGFTGHFFWVDPDYAKINQQMISFLQHTIKEKQ